MHHPPIQTVLARMAQSDHEDVVMYGSWISSLTARVKIALKLKGIDYEYVEEDMTNKSQMLLSINRYRFLFIKAGP